VGRLGTEIAKRVDIYATAIYHDMTINALNDLDLSYTPPLGSPWDAIQMAAQGWVRDHQLTAQRQPWTRRKPELPRCDQGPEVRT
jgi:hypothetical protein